MANKDEVVAKIEKLKGEIQRAVASMPEAAWSKGVYDAGWNGQQLLSHMASTSGTTGFLLRLTAAGSSSGLPAGFDNEEFNRQQVSVRQDKSPDELLAEINSIFERDIVAVRSAPDDLLAKQYRAPWEVEGEWGDVIVMSLEGHLGCTWPTCDQQPGRSGDAPVAGERSPLAAGRPAPGGNASTNAAASLYGMSSS